jgi:hypothetical protein
MLCLTARAKRLGGTKRLTTRGTTGRCRGDVIADDGIDTGGGAGTGNFHNHCKTAAATGSATTADVGIAGGGLGSGRKRA